MLTDMVMLTRSKLDSYWCLGRLYMPLVTGQNGSGQNGIRTKWYWTKWYGQNGMDKMV